jgi:hypothetical protein
MYIFSFYFLDKKNDFRRLFAQKKKRKGLDIIS